MKYDLGLDVGGTNLSAGVVDETGKLLSHASMPAGAGRSIEEITADMAWVSEWAAKEAGIPLSRISSWGIGMPSYVNPRTGLLVHANCFGWRNVPIYHYLDDKLGLPVYIENDANCALLGELAAGGARDCQNVVMLTLGTGVGGSLLVDGRLYSGADGLGAELGHTKLVFGGRRCTCGQLGCIDGYCSARGLVETARKRMEDESLLWELCGGDAEKLESWMVAEAAAQGDRSAEEAWEIYGNHLAAALSNFVAIFRPEVILLGGGVAKAGEQLLQPLRRKLRECTFAAAEIGVPEIRLAEAGNDAGIIGAAMLRKHGIDRRKKEEEG